MITKDIIQSLLEIEAVADEHLKIARREGELLITDTAQGTVALRYESPGGYSLTSQGVDGRPLAHGTRPLVRAALMALYKVERKYVELTLKCADRDDWTQTCDRMVRHGWTVTLQGVALGRVLRLTKGRTAYTVSF